MQVPQQDEDDQRPQIPKSLRYSLKVSDSVHANRKLVAYRAENAAVFNPSDVVRMNISGGEAFLDLKNSTLSFDLANTTTTDSQWLDGGASCVISSIRVLSKSGRQLDYVNNYNLISCILDQYNSNQSSMYSDDVLKGSAARLDNSPWMASTVMSTTGTSAQTLPTGQVFTASAALAGNLTVANPNGGQGYTQTQATILGTGISRHFDLPLNGLGWMNPTLGKLLPPNTPFQLEITLATATQALTRVSGSATQAFTCQNFQLKVPTISVRDVEFSESLRRSMSNNISWSTTSFVHNSGTTASGAGSDTLQLAIKARDLRGIISCFRTNSDISLATAFQNSRRSIQPISSYQYQIGSQHYPPTRVSLSTDTTAGGTAAGSRIRIGATAGYNISEAYAEVLRLFRSLSTDVGTCVIGGESYGQSSLNNGTGVIAVDVSSFTDKAVSSGLNTESGALQVSLEFIKTAAANATLAVDSFALVGVVYVRTPDGDVSMIV